MLHWLPIAYWLVVPLGLLGILGAAWARDPARGLLAAFVVLQAAGVIAFHVVERYRLAIVPCAIALGVVALFELQRRSRSQQLASGAIAAVGLLFALVLPPPTGARGQNMAGHHRLIGIDAMQRADYAEAERAFSLASRMNPRVPQFHFRLSLARRMLGDEAGAEQAARDGIRHAPERGRVELGAILMKLQPAEAARVCLRSAELQQSVIEAHHCAARALLRTGELDEASKLLLAAIEIAPNVVDLWITLGDVRLEGGDALGAQRAWQRAARLAPHSPLLEGRLDTFDRGH